jgi:hypothetical protein
MNRSAENEALEEALELERFASAVRRLPTFSRSAIDKMLAEIKVKRLAGRIGQPRK